MLQKYSPKRTVPTLFNDNLFDDMLYTFFDRFLTPNFVDSTLVGPAFYTHTHENEYIVSAELPGYGNEDIKVEVSENEVKISGKLESENGNTARVSSFHKEFTIPTDVNYDNIKATLEKGVLNVVLPRKQKDVRRIEIT
jgi:HSP20 family protein